MIKILAGDVVISIHALREEGDWPHGPFQQLRRYFYPRPPRGGRLPENKFSITKGGISIHALREEGDRFERSNIMTYNISIHALREEGDRA